MILKTGFIKRRRNLVCRPRQTSGNFLRAEIFRRRGRGSDPNRTHSVEGTNASGLTSTAMGAFAQARQDYSFVWSDETPFSSTAVSQFMVHATGGAQVFGGGMAVCGATSPNYPGAEGVFIENQSTYGAIFAYVYNASQTLPLCLNTPGGNVGIGTTTPDA
jgi:hypothetical protein